MPTAASHFDRRTLLAGAAAAAGVAAFPSRLGAARLILPLATGTLQDWSAAVGTSFTAMTEIGVMTIRLVAVEALPADPGRPAGLARSAGFFVLFSVPANLSPAGDRTYRLSAPITRTFDVYFSPAARDGLRAVFN